MRSQNYSDGLEKMGRLMDVLEDNLSKKAAGEVYELFIEAATIIVAKHKRLKKPILSKPRDEQCFKARSLLTNQSYFLPY